IQNKIPAVESVFFVFRPCNFYLRYGIFVFLKKEQMSSNEKEKKETPLMQQYNQIKTKYPDACLLFRVGDFYETFGEDAVRTAKILGITLTKRGAGSSRETE